MNFVGFLFRVAVLTMLYLSYWYVARVWVFTLVEDDAERMILPAIATIQQLLLGVVVLVCLRVLGALSPSVGLAIPKRGYNYAFSTYVLVTLVYAIVCSYYYHFELEIRQASGG